MLIDEVHLLTENRGAALEAGVISRIKMVSSLREMKEVRGEILCGAVHGMLLRSMYTWIPSD